MIRQQDPHEMDISTSSSLSNYMKKKSIGSTIIASIHSDKWHEHVLCLVDQAKNQVPNALTFKKQVETKLEKSVFTSMPLHPWVQ